MQKVHIKKYTSFIDVILNKISLAKGFHQQTKFTMTTANILNCFKLVFYLRKRYKNIYLYTRVKFIKAGFRYNIHNFIYDLQKILPSIQLETTQGHITGFTIDVINDEETLYNFLKLIAILKAPEYFYSKDTKIYKSFYNYIATNRTPIHFRITQKALLELTCYDLYKQLYDIHKYDINLSTLYDYSIKK